MNPLTVTQGFFDAATWTVSYVIHDCATRRAAVIDPVLDFDYPSGRTSTQSADRLVDYVREHKLQVDWILETHAHADHLSGAQHVKAQLGGRVAIGENIRMVQAVFKELYGLDSEFLPNGNQFDHLFKDGERFHIGDTEVTALLVPGHTPADMAYLVDGTVFVGDTLFMPDVGTARADFPGGDARALYRSTRKILSLPPETTVHVCHDYPPDSRPEPQWISSVAEQRAHNIHVHDGISETGFMAMRLARDATLEVPRLMLPALQVNVRGGRFPLADANGIAYLRIPLNAMPRQGGEDGAAKAP